jgi:hypothetical protein
MSQGGSGGKLSFLDPLTRLFRREEKAQTPEASAEIRFASLEAEFEAAIRGLNERVEQRLAESGSPSPAVGAQRDKTGERVAARLPVEAGEIAVARLIDLLRREDLPWPDPIQQGPTVTAEEVERSRQRRLGEVREAFLASGLERTADRMLGTISAWGSDYPERGSPLWQECVLEAIAAGIRADLVKEFVAVLQKDKDLLLTQTEGAVGNELAVLQRALQGGITSIDQANQAVTGALRVLDEVFPQVAWEHVRSQLPRARGEWAA